MKKRSSINITLTLIGAFVLASCGDEEEQRHVYKSKADCLADWGTKSNASKPPQSPAGLLVLPRVGFTAPFGMGSDFASRGRHATTITRSYDSGSSTSTSRRGGFGSGSSFIAQVAKNAANPD